MFTLTQALIILRHKSLLGLTANRLEDLWTGAGWRDGACMLRNDEAMRTPAFTCVGLGDNSSARFATDGLVDLLAYAGIALALVQHFSVVAFTMAGIRTRDLNPTLSSAANGIVFGRATTDMSRTRGSDESGQEEGGDGQIGTHFQWLCVFEL